MPRKATPTYTVSLRLAGVLYEANGKTVIEDLQKIKPTAFKTRGVFTVTLDAKHSQQIMYPQVCKHLLVNKIAQQIFQKRMLLTLK